MKTVDVIIERGSDGTFDANMETYSLNSDCWDKAKRWKKRRRI